MDRLDRELKDALHSKLWVEVLQTLDSDPSLSEPDRIRVEAAMAATTTIIEAARSHLREICQVLQERGIAAHPMEEEVGVTGAGAVVVAATQLAATLDGLSEIGFLGPSLSPGALAALTRVSRQIVLAPPSGPLARLLVTWNGPTRRPSVLDPTLSDLSSIRTPRVGWPVYWLVRPIRWGWVRLASSPKEVAPLVATPPELVAKLLALAEPRPQEVVYDLGCGDGRVLIEAAEAFACSGVGVEIDTALVEEAKARVAAAGLSGRISILNADLAGVDLTGASIVFAFLPPGSVSAMLRRVLSGLGPGARLIVHEQSEATWSIEPTREQLVIDDAGITVVYLWEIDRLVA